MWGYCNSTHIQDYCSLTYFSASSYCTCHFQIFTYQKAFAKKADNKQELPEETIPDDVTPSESLKTFTDSESQTSDDLEPRGSESQGTQTEGIQKTSGTLGIQTEGVPQIQKTSTMTQTDSEVTRTSRCTQTEINFTEIDLYVLYTKFCTHLRDDIIFVLNNVTMTKEKIIFNAEEFRFERIHCQCQFQESELLPAYEAKILLERDSKAYNQKMRIDRSEDGFLEKRILTTTMLKERVAGSGILRRWVQIRKEEPIVDKVMDSEDPSDSSSEEDSGDSDDSRYFEPDTASESDDLEDFPVFEEPAPFDMNDLNNVSLLQKMRDSEEVARAGYEKIDLDLDVLQVDSESEDSDDDEDSGDHVETADPENPGFFKIQL